MKIAVLSEWREPVYWWWQVHVDFLCKYLVRDFSAKVDLFTRKLYDDTWVLYDKNETHENGNRRIIRIWPKWHYFDKWKRIQYMWSTTIALYKKCKQEKYNIIHAHALLAWIPAWVVWKLLSIPVIYTVHGSIHLDSGRKNIYYYIEKFLICGLQYTTQIFVSHATLQYKNNNTRKVVIHNGVDISRFARQHCVKKSWITCLTVWRVDWQKNHIAMITALSHINPHILDSVWFMWIVVGDWPLLEYCKEQAIQLWVSKYISFAGKVFWDELVDIYHSADFFLLPSLAEWQPLTILEAFASGLPVVATDVWDNSYIVQHKSNWLLVSIKDLHALQHAIEYCIDPDHWSELLNRWENGKKLVEQQYDWHIIIAKTYEIYTSVI